MHGLEIPDHLELLLTGKPVLDIYAAGQWRVPDGLVIEIFGRARELAASDEARSMQARLPEGFLPDATAAALDLLALADFLCGSAAVRGGTCASLPTELTAGFRVEPRSFPRDPLQWEAPAGWWRPPGNWLFVGKTPRQVSLTLAMRCLEVLEGIAPLEERRRALLDLYRQRQADPQLAAQDAAAPRDDLESLWSESAGPDILAVLPELAGPDEYLGWACEGFAAAHEQLASACLASRLCWTPWQGWCCRPGRSTRRPGWRQWPGRAATWPCRNGSLPPGSSTLGHGRPGLVAGWAAGWPPGRSTHAGAGWTWACGSPGSCRDYGPTRTGRNRAGCRSAVSSATSGRWRGPGGPPTRSSRPSPCGAPRSARPGRQAGRDGDEASRPVGGGSDAAEHGGEPPAGPDDPVADLAALPGLDPVKADIGGLIAAVRAERTRQAAGMTVRATWKNLVLAGGPGTGKSRVAAIAGRIYRDLGVLSSGHLVEVTRADLIGEYARDSSTLVRAAVNRAIGGVLLISDAHDPGGASGACDRTATSSLQELVTEYRGGNLVVILAGPGTPVRQYLQDNRGLAAQFPLTIEFTGYTGEELAAIFTARAQDVGFTLAGVRDKASAVLVKSWRSGCSTRRPPGRPAAS